jgi:DNA-binding FadR family transcriptional regulator
MTPGTRLPSEAALATSFGVGRASVREAMRMLEINGLIELRTGANGGPVVTRPTTSDLGRTLSLYLQAAGATLRDLTATRLTLEPWMAGLAAQHEVAGGDEMLREVIDLDESQIADDAVWVPMSIRFHDVVSALSGRPMLDAFALALMKIHSDRVHGHLADPNLASRQRLHDVHRGIGEAILGRDPVAAEARMREHLQANFQRLEAVNPGLLDQPVEWW